MVSIHRTRSQGYRGSLLQKREKCQPIIRNLSSVQVEASVFNQPTHVADCGGNFFSSSRDVDDLNAQCIGHLTDALLAQGSRLIIVHQSKES